MDIFVIRLNQDPRNHPPKSGYSIAVEYNKIYEYFTIDAFMKQ